MDFYYPSIPNPLIRPVFKSLNFLDTIEFFLLLIPFISHQYQLFLSPPKTKLEYFLRGMIGILGIFCLYFIPFSENLKNSDFIIFSRLFLSALWLTLGSQILCNKLFSGKKNETI